MIVIIVWMAVLTVIVVYLFLLLGQVAEAAGVVDTVERHRVSTGYLQTDGRALITDVPPDLARHMVGQTLLTVLSPSCASCSELASDLAASDTSLSNRVAFVISTAVRDARFDTMYSHLQETGRGVFVDDGGTWSMSCGISLSPCVVLVDDPRNLRRDGYPIFTVGGIEGFVTLDKDYLELV